MKPRRSPDLYLIFHRGVCRAKKNINTALQTAGPFLYNQMVISVSGQEVAWGQTIGVYLV